MTVIKVVIGSLLAITALGAAQAQPPAATPQFRSGVDLVHLDISVLDRNRRPVRGLTPADFTILENGTPQEIAMFKAVDIPIPSLTLPPFPLRGSREPRVLTRPVENSPRRPVVALESGRLLAYNPPAKLT